MSRLPAVGGDTGAWGTVLNDFLGVSHNADGTIKGAAIPALAVGAQSSTAYTAAIGDAGQVVTMTNAAANNFTVPPNSSVAFPVGTVITVGQRGAGQTAIVAGAGVTINSRGSLTHIAGQYGYVSLVQVAVNVWDLSGDLA